MTSHDSSTAPVTSSSPRRPGWIAVVYLLFFLSGLTSLIYEVIWVRKFGLVFGVTTYAVSTVLAAFFAGLALGSYAAGRIIDRTRLHPLAVYGAMEGLVGAYALLLPVFFNSVEASYPLVYSRLAESFSLFTLFRFIICFALLALPTTLMGATLPVLSKLMVDREEVLGLNVGRLYAVNTFGAVTGTFSAGFLLLPTLGLAHTTLAAAVGNFLLALIALLISLSPEFAPSSSQAASTQASAPAAPLTGPEKLVLAIAFCSGLAVLALEVVWTRSLVLVLGATTYAFSTMLTAVLVGIAAGSAVLAPRADRTQNPGALLACLLFAGGLCAAFGPAIINHLPFVFLRISDWTQRSWSLVIATQFLISFLVVFVPTFLSGASFPILVRMYSRGASRVGRTVADVYAVNTLGGIIGSLAGGFVLLKYFALGGSLTIASLFLMLVSGTLAVALARPWPKPARAGAAALAVAAVVALSFVHPRFATKVLFAGWGPFAGGYYVNWKGASTVDVTDRHMQRLLYHREGVSASVDVLETGWGDKIISINAQPVATTYLYDMRALKMLGHLPVLLHRDPRDVLLIGLGAGVSSGIIATYPSVENVTVVELSEEVPAGAAKFSDWNYDVLRNPKVKVAINDGANYIKATRKQYDVISSDPIHPFIAGNSILYSHEHWKICKDRLREGGVLAQWVPLYQVSSADFATIVGTFADVFPDCSLWFCGIDTVLIGSKGPLKLDLDHLRRHMSSPAVMADLLSMGVHQPSDVLGWFVAGPAQIREIGMGAPRNSLDSPILEFSAPKALSLTGISATVPTLLTAMEEMSPHELRRQLNELCTRPLDAQTLFHIALAQLAGRWVMRGQLLYSYNFVDQYLEAISHARALRPTDRFVLQALADAQCSVADQKMEDGYPREAYGYYREAFANDPTNLMALAGAVGAAIQADDLALAQQTLDLASVQQKEVFQLRTYAGVLALKRSDYKAARRAFEQAAARRQESPTMHVGLGLLDLIEGSRDSPRAHFERAMHIATDPLDTAYDIVEVCLPRGFAAYVRPYAESLVSLATAAIAVDPGRPSLYGYRALGYSALGDENQAARDQTTKLSLLGWWEEPAASSASSLSP